MLRACGITEFLLPVEHVATARIKTQPEDFVVVEIDPNGCRTDAPDYELPAPIPESVQPALGAERSSMNTETIPDAAAELFTEQGDADEAPVLTEATRLALGTHFLSKSDAIAATDALPMSEAHALCIGVFNTRDQRERLHRALRSAFPHLRSETRRTARSVPSDGWDHSVYVTYNADYLLLAQLLGVGVADAVEAWAAGGGARAPLSASFAPETSKAARRALHDVLARRYPFLACRVAHGAVTLRCVPQQRAAPATGFTHFVLRTRGVDALGVRALLAARFGAPASAVGVAGMKDRRAVSFQRGSVPGDHTGACGAVCRPNGGGACGVEIRRAGGPFRAPVVLGALRGNAFAVRLRAVRGVSPSALRRRLGAASAEGFLNYFGPQRFAEASARTGGHVGAHLLAGRWAEALREALAGAEAVHDGLPESARPSAAPGEARDAQCVLRALRLAMRTAPDRDGAEWTRRDVLEATPRWERLCQRALRGVPFALRAIWVHAAQSLIFNHLLSRLRAEGVGGLERAELPLVGHQVAVPEAYGAALMETLAALRLDPAAARWGQGAEVERDVLGVPLPGAMRRAVVRPTRCEMHLHEGTEGEGEDGFDATLCFELPSSSYATVLLRELLGSDEWGEQVAH